MRLEDKPSIGEAEVAKRATTFEPAPRDRVFYLYSIYTPTPIFNIDSQQVLELFKPFKEHYNTGVPSTK